MAERIPRVVVVGPAYVDMAVKCDDFPQPGKLAEGSGFSCLPTGAGLNEAIQAALCGCEVFLLSRIGEDCFGEMIKQAVRRYGVATDLLYATQAISTGIVVTLVNGMGEKAGQSMAEETVIHIRDEYSTFDWIIDGMIERVGFKIEQKLSELPYCLTYVNVRL